MPINRKAAEESKYEWRNCKKQKKSYCKDVRKFLKAFQCAVDVILSLSKNGAGKPPFDKLRVTANLFTNFQSSFLEMVESSPASEPFYYSQSASVRFLQCLEHNPAYSRPTATEFARTNEQALIRFLFQANIQSAFCRFPRWSNSQSNSRYLA